MSYKKFDPNFLDDKAFVELAEWQKKQKDTDFRRTGDLLLRGETEMKPKPRTEILTFADAMEAEMSRHDAEKGDSWKECDINELSDGMGEAVEQWWNNYEYGYEQDADHYLDIANFCMMLWHRTK